MKFKENVNERLAEHDFSAHKYVHCVVNSVLKNKDMIN